MTGRSTQRDCPSSEATPDGSGGYTLSGTKMFVLDGHTANLIVVASLAAGTGGTEGISFFTVAGDAPGLTRTALPTMDQTRDPTYHRELLAQRIGI